MNKYTIEQLDKMNKAQVNAVAKKLGIKYGKLSLMQTREAIVNFKDVPKVDMKAKAKTARDGSKMAKCIDIFKKGGSRQDIIAKFASEAKVTQKALGTYYQLVKKKLATK